MIVCDKNKLDAKWCNGASDFIVEIVSSGNLSDDYIRKLYYYKNYGVREYWIVDPEWKTVTVNYFESNIISIVYTFMAMVKVNILMGYILILQKLEKQQTQKCVSTDFANV